MLEILCHEDMMLMALSLFRPSSTDHLVPSRETLRDTLHFLHFTSREAMTTPHIPTLAGAESRGEADCMTTAGRKPTSRDCPSPRSNGQCGIAAIGAKQDLLDFRRRAADIGASDRH